MATKDVSGGDKKEYKDNAEEILLRLFEDKSESQQVKAIAKFLHKSWPVLYHLSPQRHAILNWFDFGKKKSLLEIGAGCGALTGLFCERCEKVVALELEERRAEIIRRRFKEKQNLEVVVGDFATFSCKEKFDFVTLIGVLEYAGAFFGETHESRYSLVPYLKMLKRCRTLLKEEGILIIAIENKLGVKYFSGFYEDHYSIGYQSLEDYPDYMGIRTFALGDMVRILKQAGFSDFSLYLPFPDYKLPIQVLESGFLRSLDTIGINSIFPTGGPFTERLYLINEVLFAKTLKDAGLLVEFANSFLFFVKK